MDIDRVEDHELKLENSMMNLRFRQEIVGDTSNLILDVDKEMTIDSFSLNMIGRNQIQFILPMQLNQFNSDLYFRYDITGMDKLRERLAATWKNDEVLDILNSIINAFEEVDAYMLSCNNMYLNEEYIFVDEDNNCRFLFVPIEESLGENIIVFLHRLVNQIQPDYSEKDTCFFQILNAFNRGAITKLSDLKELLRKNRDAVVSLPDVARENADILEKKEKEEQIGNGLNPEKIQKEGNIKNTGFKVSFALPESIAEKKTEKKEETGSRKKDTKKSSIPIMNVPQTAKIGFEIPGIPDNGKKQEIPMKTEKEEKEVKKENKKQFRFFDKKTKVKKDMIPQESSSAIATTSEMKMSEEDMYECYEQTIILQSSVPEESDATVLMDEGIRRAELIRIINDEHFEITESNVIVGGGSLANYRINNNRKISRRHANVRMEQEHYYIKDNSSSNGTYLNGKRLIPEKEEELKDNDIIRLADEDFVFRIW